MRYLKNVVTLAYEPSLCNGCRRCVDVCPHQVFAIEHKRAVVIDRDACMECGACALNCEPGAITVDAGVGCAYAVLNGWFHKTDPVCDCGCTSTTETQSCC